jgi:uncharacterized protein YbcI
VDSITPETKSEAGPDRVERGSERGALMAAISNTIVGLHKRYFGKGPTKARSYLLDEMVVCVLRGGRTRAEQTLIDSGRSELVTKQRHDFQEAVRDEFATAVELLVGKRVVAFMSTSSPEPDVSVEIFILENDSQPE